MKNNRINNSLKLQLEAIIAAQIAAKLQVNNAPIRRRKG